MPAKSHGLSACRNPTYETWQRMLRRCYTPGNSSYRRYGGRGITVCERWRGPFGFVNFVADMGEKPDGLELDRVNNDGNYEPGNCRWVTRRENSRNRRSNRPVTHGDRTQLMSDWAAEFGLPESTLRMRLSRGWTMAEALAGIRAGRKRDRRCA